MLGHIRYLVVPVIFGLSAILYIPFLFIRPFHPENLYPFVKRLRPILLWALGLKVQLRDWPLALKNRPCIYMGNHQHNVDAVVFGFSAPCGTVTLMKHSLIYMPVFGFFVWMGGHFFIKRRNKKQVKKTMQKIGKTLNENNSSILMMPEGTRNTEKEVPLLPLKKGGFKLAIDLQIPIVPLIASSYKGPINFHRWHAGKVILQALPPLYPPKINNNQQLAEKELADFLQKVQTTMQVAHEKLNREITTSPAE